MKIRRKVSVIPKTRTYTFVFEDIVSADSIEVLLNDKKQKATITYADSKIYVRLYDVTPKDSVKILFKDITARTNRDKKEMIIELITKYQLGTAFKMIKYGSFIKDIYSGIPASDECFSGPIEEILQMK